MKIVVLCSVLMAGKVLAETTNRPTARPEAPDFATEVLPVLTKAGCNTGACHGAAQGRGGFHLSLRGGDPDADYEAMVHALEGRRIHRVDPDLSLLLAKPLGNLDHGGGVRLAEGSAGLMRLRAWIFAGVPRGKGRRLLDFEVSPLLHQATVLPARVPLRARARFDQDEWEDVTAWTEFVSHDPASLAIVEDLAGTGFKNDTRNGIHPSTDDIRPFALLKRRGQHGALARFLDRVVPLRFTMPLGDAVVLHRNQPRANFIDDEILATLARLRLPVSPPADEATFLRRVTLDLTGRLPTPESAQTFLADRSQDKRKKLIEHLLHSDGFVDYWTLRFSRLLRLHELPNEPASARAYSLWLRGAMQKGAPWDVMTRQLLTASGDSHQVGPANFGRMVNDARAHAELVSQVFMGARLDCANCHHHPLDKWKQEDYHGLAAIFANWDRGRQVRRLPRGAVTNPRTGMPAIARIPGSHDLAEADNAPDALADWLTDRERPLLARALVNRLWKAMFGRGLVEPTDDMRQTNLPTHPELLDQLARDFMEHGYDIRHALRRIAQSHTYARASVILHENRGDDHFYSRASRRPLEAEVLADAIADVLDVPTPFVGHPQGTRAVALVDTRAAEPVLELLGRCVRADRCTDGGPTGNWIGTSAGLTLAGQLHLLNGDLIHRKFAHPHNRLRRMLGAGFADSRILEELYWRAFSRSPTPTENKRWLDWMTSNNSHLSLSDQERLERWEDFLWSMLNNRDFTQNH